MAEANVRFREAQQCVRDFFDEALLRGQPLISIVDGFKEGPVSDELRISCKKLGLTDNEIRRHGQIIGTRYLIRQYQQQSAQLPDSDLLASGNDAVFGA